MRYIPHVALALFATVVIAYGIRLGRYWEQIRKLEKENLDKLRANCEKITRMATEHGRPLLEESEFRKLCEEVASSAEKFAAKRRYRHCRQELSERARLMRHFLKSQPPGSELRH